MLHRAFFSAFAAILLSAVLVQTAAAYPSTTRSGTTTVTGAYRPLNLDLALVSGNLNYSGGILSFYAEFTGTFEAVGYNASGLAGDWGLSLSGTGIVVSPTVIALYAPDGGVQMGTLDYFGGLQVLTGALQPADTPAVEDVFKLYSSALGPVFFVSCQDGVDTCNDFELILVQDLRHVGPFVGADLDLNRQNQVCRDPSCVLTGLYATSVPEPATLALLGLGLAGLGLSRRTRTRT